jgi:hypothetical protein
MTACQISRNNAELRIRAVLDGKKAPVAIELLAEAEQSDADSRVPTDIAHTLKIESALS